MGRPKKEVSVQNIEKFQRELALAGNRSEILLQDKKGRSRSCLLCKRRKQKCDHKLPSCTACLKASVKCIQPARYNQPKIKKEEEEETPTSTDTTSTNSTESKAPLGQSEPLQLLSHVQKQGNFASVKSLTPPTSLSTSSSVASSLSSCSNPSPNAPESNSLYSSSTIQTNENNPPLLVQKKSSGKVAKKRKDDGKDQYTAFLERKLRYLEKLIDLPIGGSVFNKKLNQYKKITHLLGEIDDLETTVAQLPAIQKEVIPKKEPLDYNNRIPSRLIKPDNSIPALSSDSLDSIDFNKCIFAKYFSKKYFPYDPAFEFDPKLFRSFLDTFFTRLQFKYPILDEQEIYSFHHHYSKNNIYSYSTNEFHFASGRMWLVFSISAYMQKTTGKYKGLEPARYFSTAVRHITKCGDNLNFVHRVELLTLLVLYLIRTDRDSMVLYQIMKDVMFICKNKLSLNQWFPNDPFSRKKLRLFWCVYLLERMICEAVGKPFTISESEINLPYFDEQSFNAKDSTQIRNVHFINQSLKLRRIESSFVEDLQLLPDSSKEVMIGRESQLTKVNDYFRQLEVWRASCSTNHVKNFENETLKLYYYRSVRLLIQPYLEFLKPEDRLFRECQAAAGQICQLYKIFHQKTINGHSTPAVHTVFVAGVTLVYCMWIARNYDDERRRKLGDESKHTRPLISASLFSTMDDLRACSVCLYVMTERSKFARVFRDTFDELMNATIGNLITRCGPNSSELIHLSKFKNKVENDRLQLNGSNNNNLTVQRQNSEPSQSSSDNDDASQNPNGMPPARKRVFGMGQAEEHAGFVQHSQVDIEEQIKLKKKQDDLEKESLPQGLAHLLVNEREDNRTKNAKNNENPQKVVDENQQYIVKKPINSNDFDWKMFQQQAYMQQQAAQQNLQAYLSSLNYAANKQASDQNQQSVHPPYHGNQDNMLPHDQQQPNTSRNMMPLGSNIMLDNDVLMSQIARSATPNISNLRTQTPIQYPNNTNSSEADDQRKSQMSTNSSLSSMNPAAGISINGVLFNNGTHDMINNISNWTNDSIVNGVPMQIDQDLNVPRVHSSQNQIYADDPNAPPHQAQFLPSYNQQRGMNIPMGVDNNYPPSMNRNMPGPLMNHQMASQVVGPPPPQPHHNQHESIGNADSGFPKINNNNIPRGSTQYAEYENIAPSAHAEEFWTINDDYGFLT
ncbi:hypothetical protein MOUN0_O09076 [Monosporozyma unispora]